MARKQWVLSPHTGGSKVPVAVQDETQRRILCHAERHYHGLFTRIGVRFRGQFCYIVIRRSIMLIFARWLAA